MVRSRREFVSSVVGAAAGAILGAVAHAARTPATQVAAPIIDAHIHIWDLKKIRLPWLDQRGDLNRTFSMDDYAQATRGLPIARCVYVEVNAPADQKAPEAEQLIAIIKAGGPLAGAVIGGDPAAPGFADYLRRFAKSPQVRGVRHFHKKEALTDARFIAGVRLVGELGLPFDLSASGDLLEQSVAIVDACPQTQFLLNHCGFGNADWFDADPAKEPEAAARRQTWERAIGKLAERPNVACKISGVAESCKGPITEQRLARIVDHCLAKFGVDRVIFGSNWPVCLRRTTIADWHRLLAKMTEPRGPELSRRLFHDNAIKWYRLPA